MPLSSIYHGVFRDQYNRKSQLKHHVFMLFAKLTFILSKWDDVKIFSFNLRTYFRIKFSSILISSVIADTSISLGGKLYYYNEWRLKTGVFYERISNIFQNICAESSKK